MKKSLFLFLLVGLANTLGAQEMSLDYALQNNEWVKAIAKLEGKKDAFSQLRLGNVYLAKGDMAKAKSIFEAVQNSEEAGHFAYVAEARVKLLAGDADGADDLLKKAEKKSRRKKADVLLAIGETYTHGKKRDLKKAEELLKNAYNNHSKDYDIFMALAYTYKEMPKGGDAVKHYEFAEAVNSSALLPTHMIAKVFWGTRNYPKYEEYLKKVVNKDRSYVPAKRDLADYLYYKKRVAEAAPYYEELVKIPNPLLEDEITLVNCYFLLKDCDKVIATVPGIIERNPEVNYLRRLLAYCAFENGDVAKANEIMEEYFKNVPKDKIISSDWEYRGRIQNALENDSMAIEHYRMAVDMEPSKYELYQNIGKAYYSMKDYCNAAEAFQFRLDSLEASEKSEATATDYYYLGLTRYYCKDDEMRYVNAEKAFDKVIEISPTAATGYEWKAKAQAQQDPDMRNDSVPDFEQRIADFGMAKETYEKYIEILENDLKADDAKVDAINKKMTTAYEYLVYFYYIKKDYPNFDATVAKLLSISPSNKTGQGLKSIMDEERGIGIDGN